MKASVEISYYPLKEEYVSPIRGFIDRIRSYEELTVRTNGMSTQIFGEFEPLMAAVTREIGHSFDVQPSVFVMKVVNADLNTRES